MKPKYLKEYTLVAKRSKYENINICDSETAYKKIKQIYNNNESVLEKIYVLFLNRANVTTGYVELATGSTNQVIIDVNLICKFAIDSLAYGVIITHNHPSGSLRPSIQDDNVTEELRNKLKFFNIILLDHIIVNEFNEYYSYKDDNKL